MKIQISDNLIQHYLRNVYFINGHSCAGKSTMVKMLAQRYGMIACGENFHDVFPREELSRWKQPGLCYYFRMKNSEIIHLIKAVLLAAVNSGNRKIWHILLPIFQFGSNISTP